MRSCRTANALRIAKPATLKLAPDSYMYPVMVSVSAMRTMGSAGDSVMWSCSMATMWSCGDGGVFIVMVGM